MQPWLPGGHRALVQPMLHPGPTALTDSRDLPWSFLQRVGQDLPVHPDPALSSLPPSLTCPSTMGTKGGRTPSARHCPTVPTSTSPEGSILLLPGRHLKPSQLQAKRPWCFQSGEPNPQTWAPQREERAGQEHRAAGFSWVLERLGQGRSKRTRLFVSQTVDKHTGFGDPLG